MVIEIDGDVIGPLPHAVKHSPTGMTWGYCGSGPADLARSLLIHALGDDARCTVCEGTGEVVYDVIADREIPYRYADLNLEHLHSGESDSQPRYSEPMGCQYCERGFTVLPSLYQRFKFDIVANLPESGWTLTRAEILQWVAQHRQAASQ
nr:DUF6166 domain-containing protein [Mycobacterium avium]